MKKILFILCLVIVSVDYYHCQSTACGLLEIEDIMVNPLNTTEIYISVNNESDEIFSYPQFVLVDDNSDTIAIEETDLFGIGLESYHYLEITSDFNFNNNFSGTLYLYSGFGETEECSFIIDEQLIDEVICHPIDLYINFYNGINTFSEWVDYKVYDENNNVVLNESVYIYQSNSPYYEEICLSEGCYRLKIVYDLPEQMSGYYALHYGESNNLNYEYFSDFSSSESDYEINFGIYSECNVASVKTDFSNRLNVFPNPAKTIIEITGTLNLKSIQIIDLSGKVVLEALTSKLSISELNPGFYILNIMDGNSLISKKIIIE